MNETLPHDSEKTSGCLDSGSSDHVGEGHDGEGESRLEQHDDGFGGGKQQRSAMLEGLIEGSRSELESVRAV